MVENKNINVPSWLLMVLVAVIVVGLVTASVFAFNTAKDKVVNNAMMVGYEQCKVDVLNTVAQNGFVTIQYGEDSYNLGLIAPATE